MGHKTHPLGFRLGITQQHYSSWYSKLTVYSKLIQEDFKIRKVIQDYLEFKNFDLEKRGLDKVGLNKILIVRTNDDEIVVSIELSSPGKFIGRNGIGIQELYKRLQSIIEIPSLRIFVNEVKEKFVEANMVGDMLVQELTKQTPFRRAMKLIIKNVSPSVQGIKIQISGRLNGAEIARTEWRKEGRIPLQTLRAQIDYTEKIAPTKYGILGVKVWLFKGEILNIKKLGS